MTRHPVDLFSLVAGLLVLAMGLLFLSGGLHDIPMQWLGPAVAIGLGIVIAVAARPSAPSRGESHELREDQLS